MTMLVHTVAAAALLLQSAAPPKAVPPPQKAPAAAAKPAATDLAVTLTYKGKGAVDANHKLLVWLFADANITPASRPLATRSITKNGDTVTFKDAPTTPVYVFAVYDQAGGYDGVSGPPPAGSPSVLYRKVAKGDPTPVKAGGPPIKITFDDSQRWK